MQLLDGCLLLSILFIPCALVRQVGLKAWAVPPSLVAHIHFHLWGQFKIVSFRKTALGYSQSNSWGEELEGIYRVHCVQLLDYFRASQKSKHILNGIIQTSLEHWKTWGINTIKVMTGTPGKLAHIQSVKQVTTRMRNSGTVGVEIQRKWQYEVTINQELACKDWGEID